MCTAVLVSLATAPATAEPLDTRPIARRGVVVGVQGGWGLLASERCDGCGLEGGGFFAMHVGHTVGPRFALLGGLGWGGQGGHSILSIHALGRYFVTPRAWLDGGVGLGTIHIDEGNPHDTQFNGVTGQLAAGHDLLQGRAFALDASLRAMWASGGVVGGERRRDDLLCSVQLGATWY